MLELLEFFFFYIDIKLLSKSNDHYKMTKFNVAINPNGNPL